MTLVTSSYLYKKQPGFCIGKILDWENEVKEIKETEGFTQFQLLST